MAGALLVLSEREAKGGAGNAMLGELCGSLSRGQQCQDCRGAWTRSQATGDGQARGGRPGAARCWAGPSEARRAREAGWADFDRGPEVRRRPEKEKKSFSKYIFKEFLHAIFQILF